MRYPQFIKKGNTIGITAPSAGILDKIESYERSIQQLNAHGFLCVETENVRSSGFVSSDKSQRAKQVMELYHNEDVQAIICATGGDFLNEILPEIDYEYIKANPKWIQGYSDPTSLLYSILVNCDQGTIYGPNAGGFDMNSLHSSLEDNLEILKGNIVDQSSFDNYQSGWKEDGEEYLLDSPVYWETKGNHLQIEGRMIGGCMDCLGSIIGTPYDGTRAFVEKYKNDGFIWYFDIFSMKAEDVARELWHMKEAGWFENIKGVIVGRVRFPESFLELSYPEAFERILGDVPMVFQADIGHVKPSMTIINGSIGQLKVCNGKAKLKMKLVE